MALTKVSYSMIGSAPINVEDYGAVGDGVTNDSDALVAAVAAVNALGGATLTFGQGKNYLVDWSSSGDVLLTFADCKNTSLIGNGSTITFTNSASATKVFIRANNCDGFSITDFVFTGSLSSLSSSSGGEIFVNALNGSRNIRIGNVSASGAYRFFGANNMTGASDSPVRETNRVQDIFIYNVYLNTVYYGFYFGFSGDNVKLSAKTVNTGRTYYVANANNHDVFIDGTHGGPFSDCLISCQSDAAYSAQSNTIENINLNYSTLGRYAGSGAQSSLEALVAFDFTIVSTTSAPGHIRNIDVKLNVVAKATDTTSNVVTFRKYYNNGSAIVVDSVGGRSHQLKRVTITGQARDCQYLTEVGLVLFGTQGSMNWGGDIINGVTVRDFNSTGIPVSGTAISVNGQGGVLTTQTFTLSNVTVDGNISVINSSTANLAYQGVRSGNFEYYDTDISSFPVTLAGSVANPTIPVQATARAVKKGRSVTVEIAFSNVNTTGASGNVLITDLPWVAGNGTFVGTATSINFNVPGSGLIAVLNGGSTTIEIMSPQNNAALLNSTYTATGTGRYLFVTLTYFVS